VSASVVDVVFVVDASESMRPCFESLARNLEQFLSPLQGFRFRIRLGLVAVKVGRSADGSRVIYTETLAGSGLDPIYAGDDQSALFTESPTAFIQALRRVELAGDENSLLALDFALDFPFGPVGTTRRVVAMFSDERVEDGAVEDGEATKLPELIKKIGDRRVLLFAAVPASPLLDLLGSVDGAQIHTVQGGDGLGSVDFGKLMRQMAKTISVASLQGNEGLYKRALFGQDAWGTASGSFDSLR
jgi:hypothetical protein